MPTWREYLTPYAMKIWDEVKTKDEKQQRKAFREGWKWGERSLHPYKIWRSICNNLMGTKKSKSADTNTNQMEIF